MSSLLADISGTLVGGAMNFATDQVAGYQNRQFTREMYDKSRQDNLAQWHRNNAYNSPEAQRQRLVDAGLNPALMYGGQGGGGVASQTPKGGDMISGNQQGTKMPGMFEVYALRNMKAEASRQQSIADQEKIRTEAMKSLANDTKRIYDSSTNTETIEITNWIKEGMKQGFQSTGVSNDLNRSRIEEIKSKMAELAARIERYKHEKEYKDRVLEWQKQYGLLGAALKVALN